MIKSRNATSSLALSLCALLCACGTTQLARSTVSTGRTANDILYAMILENVEMIKLNPDALPWHVKITQGSITISDSFTPTASYSHAADITKMLQLAGTQSAQVSWTIVPVVEKQTLTDLQSLYRAAAGEGFDNTFSENSQPIKGQPCGSFAGTTICVKDMAKFTILVTDVLAKTTISAAERGVQLPGPAVMITP